MNIQNDQKLQNDLNMVFEKIQEIVAKSSDGDNIYRGEPKYYDKVSSTLYREYEEDIEEDFDIEVAQKEMLSDAKRHIGYLPHTGDPPKDFRADLALFLDVIERNTDETIDFELLTEIQHYGGKTNLIDFTTDYFIALFFACENHDDEDGRVILKKTEEIKDIIEHPRNPRHRVIAQKSVFVRPPKGFIEPVEDDMVPIPANLKKLVLQYLRTYHGISIETIYNDLYGYIRNQDSHDRVYLELYTGATEETRSRVFIDQLNR